MNIQHDELNPKFSTRTEHRSDCHVPCGWQSPTYPTYGIAKYTKQSEHLPPPLPCLSALFLVENSCIMTWKTKEGEMIRGVYVKPKWKKQAEWEKEDECSLHFNQSSVATLRLLEFSL